MSNYWSWRIYRHQQGSLVWKPRKYISRFYYWMKLYYISKAIPKHLVSFKVID